MQMPRAMIQRTAFVRGCAKDLVELVEPLEPNFRKLQRAYEGVRGVSLVQAAIAHEDGTATMYRAKDDGRWRDDKWVGQIASFERQHLLDHGVRRDEIEEVSVPALSSAA